MWETGIASTFTSPGDVISSLSSVDARQYWKNLKMPVWETKHYMWFRKKNDHIPPSPPQKKIGKSIMQP